jgi:hypothetical protein
LLKGKFLSLINLIELIEQAKQKMTHLEAPEPAMVVLRTSSNIVTSNIYRKAEK